MRSRGTAGLFQESFEMASEHPDKAAAAPPEDDGYKWRAIGIVIIGTFMAILDSSIVNVALPHMMAAFGTDIETIKWVATAYMIAYGVVVLTSNHLGIRMGHERLYIYALILFTIGSFLCGKAWSIGSMIFFRAFQAVGGGLMLPTGMTIITKSFKPSERGTAFGVFGLVILLAPVLGPTLGGYIVDSMDWHWIFLVNIPVGIAGVLIAASVLRLSPYSEAGAFDWTGLVSLGTALTAMLIALSQGERWGWHSTAVVICYTLSAVGLFIFIVFDIHIKNPIVDLSIFSNFNFSLIFAMSFLRAVCLFGRTIFLSLFMQTIMGYTAMQTGFYLIPGAIVAGMATPIFGKLSDRIDVRFLLVTGSLISAFSFWQYRSLSVISPYDDIFWPMLIFGLGMGMVSSPMMSSSMNAVHPRQIGVASTLQTVVLQVGGAYGINILEALINNRAAYHLQNQVESYTLSAHNIFGRSLPISIFHPAQGLKGAEQMYIVQYQQLAANAWAYCDAFVILTALSLLTAVLALFYRHQASRDGKPAHSEAAVEAG